MKTQGSEPKGQAMVSAGIGSKTVANTAKVKSTGKEMPLSPTAPQPPENPELLGSVTTTLQQRTSARVIKKLRLDDAAADREKKEIPECDSQKLKDEEKETLKLTVKQRMPKALWSADEKNLFFEALNEYGKDFDAITSYICAKMKKKGVIDANLLKTKSQVSHFYYRTWNKLSKYVHFDENVKKVAQELYALINYGELRKKLCSVEEKSCARLSELVSAGSLVVRSRGKNVRVRTPVCRALRTLNQISACGGGGVPGRGRVVLRARCAAGWARVQAAAHNPRLHADLPLPTTLAHLIHGLERRWDGRRKTDKRQTPRSCDVLTDDIKVNDIEDTPERDSAKCEEGKEDMDGHLNLPTEQVILQEFNLPKRPVLHVGPSPKVTIHYPVITASEHLSSQKICYASYLERVKDTGEIPKIRTPKRHRKDSVTEKEVIEQKKVKNDAENEHKIDIEETAIDGIELMASYKSNLEEEINLEDEKDSKVEVEDVDDRDKDMSEKEKDSFSEMEDDLGTKSESENESDHGKDKDDCDGKVKKLKVKFRIKSRKRGGSVYTLITDDHKESSPDHQTNEEIIADEQNKTTEETRTPDVQIKINDDKFTEDIVKSLTDQTKSSDQTKMTDQIKDQNKPDIKLNIDQTKSTVDTNKSPTDQLKSSPELMKDEQKVDDFKNDVDIEFVTKQIRKGWSRYDAGDLTIGDLYLMFGSRAQIELDYWWALPTPPLTPPHKMAAEKTPPLERAGDGEKSVEKKVDKTPEKDSSLEDDKEKSDTDIFSPKNVFGQDSNDGLSGDERKGELIPDSKAASSKTTFRLANKLINRPEAVNETQNHLAVMSERLKRLLALAGNPTVPTVPGNTTKCTCGHVCGKKKIEKADSPPPAVFRHPAPIAPKPNNQDLGRPLELQGLPRWRRRGGGGGADKRVVVQRLLPLLPKAPSDLVPVKLIPNSPPQLPRLAPKPAANIPEQAELYIVSECNGQCYLHDGDRRIPIAMEIEHPESPNNQSEEPSFDVKSEVTSQKTEQPEPEAASNVDIKSDNGDISSFLPLSGSLSPSRLLEGGAWLDSELSLSSLLRHLEPRPDSNLESPLPLAESSVDYVRQFADLTAAAAAATDTHDNHTDADNNEQQ